MEKLLIFIKHHFYFLWRIIERVNSFIFSIFFEKRLKRTLPQVFIDSSVPPFTYRRLNLSDAEPLLNLVEMQDTSDLEYFRPHKFDLASIMGQFKNRSLLMMGAFDDTRLVGYFFLRFFANRQCFVGRLIDSQYRGKGIGPVMNNIMYETAWRMKFRCLSTISRKNTAVMRAHSRNQTMVVLKELGTDYLLVEFLKEVNVGSVSHSGKC